MRRLLALLAFGWMSLAATPALAHKPSDSYLTVTAQDAGIVRIDWHIALRDLDSELHLDANDDGRLTWGEVRTRWPEIVQYASGYLSMSHRQQACAMQQSTGVDAAPRLITHTDGQYAVLAWAYHCPVQSSDAWQQLDIDYRLFALADPTHRGIVHWRSKAADSADAIEGGTVVLGIPRPQYRMALSGLKAGATAQPERDTGAPSLAPAQTSLMHPTLPGAQPSTEPEQESVWRQLSRFIQDGMHHIAVGTDHILFLISLLLVSVWQRPRPSHTSSTSPKPINRCFLMDDWQARPSWQASWREVLKLVTAFTLAHSMTLGLASFGVLSPPSRWVESLIALSVLVAAVDNLVPIMPGPRWIIVFGFGLVHGFGFASALQDLALSGSALAVPLLGFNLGVEAGQLSLVAVFLPLACWIRHTRFYRVVMVGLGSTLIAAMALIWLIERMANVTILGWGG